MLLLTVFWSACSHGPPAPVDVEAGDTCSRCRMTISERRYAAELIKADGTVLKFDDIGCLRRSALEPRADWRPVAMFVTDYETGRWIPARRAHYAQAPAIQSPMASGIIALESEATAARYARRYGVSVLSFEQLTEH